MTIEFDIVTATVTLTRTVYGGSWMKIGWREYRSRESETGKSKQLFKNFRCLEKQRKWATAGGGVTSGKICFLGWELLSGICLLKKWYSRKEKIAKEFREMRWDPVNKRGG